MSKTLIRHLRLFCASPDRPPVRHKDGVLAVAGVLETAGLARLLLVDMGRWGRNPGASVTSAVDQLVPAAHRYLIGGFDIPLADTLVVVQDRSGAFDFVSECGSYGGGKPGLRHQPLFGANRSVRPRSPEAFIAAAGQMGQDMLDRAEAIGVGEWAGVEG